MNVLTRDEYKTAVLACPIGTWKSQVYRIGVGYIDTIERGYIIGKRPNKKVALVPCEALEDPLFCEQASLRSTKKRLSGLYVQPENEIKVESFQQ